MIEVNQESLATGVGGIGGLLVGGRLLFSWWKKQGFTDAQVNAADGLMDRIEADAKKWRELYEETHKLLEEQRRTNHLLESQLYLMKALLVQRGATPDELAALGVQL